MSNLFVSPNGKLFAEFPIGIYRVHGISEKRTKGNCVLGQRINHASFPAKWLPAR